MVNEYGEVGTYDPSTGSITYSAGSPSAMTDAQAASYGYGSAANVAAQTQAQQTASQSVINAANASQLEAIAQESARLQSLGVEQQEAAVQASRTVYLDTIQSGGVMGQTTANISMPSPNKETGFAPFDYLTHINYGIDKNPGTIWNSESTSPELFNWFMGYQYILRKGGREGYPAWRESPEY